MAVITNLMRYPGVIALALFHTSLLGADNTAQAVTPLCPAPFAKLLSDEVFKAHAVHSDRHKIIPAPPNVKSGRSYMYRTMIKEGARLGPNFAGQYTIIRIGCGAATTCVAIVDAKSGKVYFPSQVVSVEALLVDTGSMDVRTLNYRRDSSLLVVVGSPNENRKRAGISYYEWKSGILSLVRFISASKICGLPESTQF